YTAVVTAGYSVGELTATMTVTVDEAIAGLEATNDSPTILGSATTCTATITAGSNVTYTWAFGDGAYGWGDVVLHTYPGVGGYTAVVTASNSVSLLTATTRVTIAESYCFVYLPVVIKDR
ncbi:MAG: PKD domain-containing protein, partial [Anaerolineae bacterium]